MATLVQGIKGKTGSPTNLLGINKIKIPQTLHKLGLLTPTICQLKKEKEEEGKGKRGNGITSPQPHTKHTKPAGVSRTVPDTPQ